mmetsp:Transcript_4506/g.14974  ORF Transcript_4506/g.14974 Transcript_4506/m.14974 type:complete len:291 (-) Transcript_4506:22-894(-)
MPSFCASGTKICVVSLAMRTCLCLGICRSVRMLCSRSASLTTTIRQSSPMATSIARWLRERLVASSRAAAVTPSFERFVSPSTIEATLGPKQRAMSCSVRSVSSTVSWRRPATMVSRSILSPAKMVDVSTGCTMNGSPFLRAWPACAAAASCTARCTTRLCPSKYHVARVSPSSASPGTRAPSAKSGRPCRLASSSHSLADRVAAALEAAPSAAAHWLGGGRPLWSSGSCCCGRDPPGPKSATGRGALLAATRGAATAAGAAGACCTASPWRAAAAAVAATSISRSRRSL